MPIASPRFVRAAAAVVAPVPPATMGRGVFASVAKSSIRELYFALSMLVPETAVVPASLLKTPEPSLGILASLFHY